MSISVLQADIVSLPLLRHLQVFFLDLLSTAGSRHRRNSHTMQSTLFIHNTDTPTPQNHLEELSQEQIELTFETSMSSGFRGSRVSAGASKAGAGADDPDNTLVAGSFGREIGILKSLSTRWMEELWLEDAMKSGRAWSRDGTSGWCSSGEVVEADDVVVAEENGTRSSSSVFSLFVDDSSGDNS